MQKAIFFSAIVLVLCLATTSQSQPNLDRRLVASGLSSPVFVTSPPSDYTRQFIVERSGRVKIVRNDTLLARPFLNISTEITSGNERGLLGMAFHPDYASNGKFYLNFTGGGGATYVVRMSVSSDPDSADVSNRDTLLVVPQPYSNHNAGMLAFSPNDGYLYVGLGDGGNSGDPQNRAQNPDSLLGKMLRLDVDGGLPYAIPPDNPYAGNVDTLEEIWAFGLRNPWRYSFDRMTGDLYIADVGQALYEEVNVQAASSAGGENYGWRLKEATHCYNPPTMCDTLTGLTDPVAEYTHGGSPFRCSVTGGYVYRGCAIPDLDGYYLYADYCSGQIWAFRYVAGMVFDSTEFTADLNPSGNFVTSFGEDAAGEIYFVDFSVGAVYKIIPASGEVDCPVVACCVDQSGDINGDGANADPVDLSFAVDFLFSGGTAPTCEEEADVDGSGGTAPDPVDLSYLVDFLFSAGPAPVACP